MSGQAIIYVIFGLLVLKGAWTVVSSIIETVKVNKDLKLSHRWGQSATASWSSVPPPPPFPSPSDPLDIWLDSRNRCIPKMMYWMGQRNVEHELNDDAWNRIFKITFKDERDAIEFKLTFSENIPFTKT